MARTVACTICSSNYLAQARTLMESLARVHPDWDRHVLVVDEIGDRFDRLAEPFRVSEISQLPIADARRFFFRYTILELNTAVKPVFLRWLFQEEEYDRVVYLDPDIVVYEPLEEVESALDAGALMCLTPHLTAPLFDDKKPSEVDILRAGAYNLGFIALARHRDLLDFLGWWEARTEKDCVVDFGAGYFVDQRWIDLVPGMYDDVCLVRNEGYNVAYWNLAHRTVRRAGDSVWVNGDRLAFFHFSGFDPANPDPFSKHQDRFALSELEVVGELAADYARRLEEHGHAELRTLEYALGRFADGEPIPDEVRSLYRNDARVVHEGGVDPFALGHEYFNRPFDGLDTQPLVSRLMHHIWCQRGDLQRHFPDPGGASRFDYAYWFVERIAEEHALPESYVRSVRESLAGRGRSWSARRALLARRLNQRLNFVTRRFPRSWKDRLRPLQTPPPGAAPRRAPTPSADLAPGIDVAGFHPVDEHDRREGAAWMGPRGQLRLVERPAGRLRIEGEHHAGLHAGRGPDGLRLRVALDGELVGEVRLEHDGPFREELMLPRGPGPESILSLSASGSVVPADVGIGEDPRELSLRIARIALDDEPVLDFGAEGAPYRLDRRPALSDIGLNIVGYVRSELGVGESARLCALAAEAAGIPFELVDFSEGCASRAEDRRWEEHLTQGVAEGAHPVSVFHINADQLPVAYGHFGPDFFEGRYNVGVWHWELPEFPDRWLGSYELVDELWAPSRMVMESLAEKSGVPVVYMPHAISFEVPPGATRKRFGLPDDRFLFLCMYDMHSSQARKNPEAALEAFRAAFPDARDAGLVVKVMNADSQRSDLARLEERLAELPGAFLIDETLQRADVYALESVCDAYVSLHRSEGFGLGLAESMYLGKPVIGTHWSGNADFMSHENSCPVRYELVALDETHGPYEKGQQWAEPDVEQAAHFMRELVRDEPFRRRIALAGQRTIRSQHSPEAIGRRYRRRLEWIARRIL